jgi:coproporphyrinogen III oxidase
LALTANFAAMTNRPKKEAIADWFRGLQLEICRALEETDGGAIFKEDSWKRAEGGGGFTNILTDGAVIEKGGVAFSAVHGLLPDKIKAALGISAGDFFATGVSIVIHPLNPWVPIIHMNVRYFELSDGTHWFGGGIDLTPHYIMDEDARSFHEALKATCDTFHPVYYPKFKEWADEYFFIPHRKETRGIGGIFFDRLSENEEFSFQDRFAFVQAVGKTFAPVYTRFMAKNSKLPYSATDTQWQKLRRGRYVEFNLVYDKGTKFGLDTNGRIESILMSLPKEASWLYDFKPEAGSEAEKTLQKLKKGIQWA